MPAKKPLPTPTPDHAAAFTALRAAFVPFMEQKPYLHVYDSTLLAVEVPGTKETCYAYIMGEMGEMVGFNVFTAKNIGYWIAELNEHIYEGLPPDTDVVQATPMWQVCYARANDMDPLTKALNGAAGVVFKKGVRRAGMEALEMRPGYHPDPAGPADVAMIAAIVPGLAHLVAHLAATTDREGADDLTRAGRCLVARQSAVGEWAHIEEALPAATPMNPLAAQDGRPTEEDLAPLRTKPRGTSDMLIEAGFVPGTFREGDNQVQSRMICGVNMNVGMILGFKLVPIPQWATESHDAIAGLLGDLLELPGRIIINDARMKNLLAPWCAGLEIDLITDERIPGIVDSMFGMMGSGLM